MLRASLIIAAIALVILFGSRATPAAQGDSLLSEIAALMRTNLSESGLDARLGSLTERAVKDRAGRYRYGTTMGSLSCVITAGYGFITDSLDFILVDFRDEDYWMGPIQGEYDTLRQELMSIFGKPASEMDGKKALREFRIDVRQSAWNSEFGSCVLVLDRTISENPEFGALFLTKAASDSLALADAEMKIDPRIQPRARMEWARSRFISGFVLADSLPMPVRGALSDDPAQDSIVVLEMPVERRHTYPKYPERAVQEAASGTVWIQALVGIDGKVTEAHVLKGPGTGLGFEQAALEAAYKNEYSPAIGLDGEPVPVWVSYKVDFKFRR